MACARLLVVGFALAAAGCTVAASRSASEGHDATSASSADARQREILREDLGLPADAALARRYSELNARYFSNALPATPVVWEPRLDEVGALAGRSFTLLGVFGQSGDRTIILLHPTLRGDADALDRALCHEMVHAYLFTLGDTSTNHGDAFQSVLRRLSNEGAFAGVAATPGERAELRKWLDAESTRLEGEQHALDELMPQLERDRAVVERTGQGVDAYNGRVDQLNHRVLDLRLAREEFDRQLGRYKLMASYPDGLDEKSPGPHS